MKKKLTSLLIISFVLAIPAKVVYGFDNVADFTGEAFFAPPVLEQPKDVGTLEEKDDKHTVPPLKQLRLKLKNRAIEKESQNFELAPTATDVYRGEVGTSEYASKEIKENFDDVNADLNEETLLDLAEEGKEKKKQRVSKKKKKKSVVPKDSDNIILDCQKVDYDSENYMIYATGNVSVTFVKQKIVIKSDIITFDRVNNTIKAEGNVRIYKSGRVITGDYIFVDMNEENALIENPVTRSANIEIKSERGFVYGDSIVQENGTMIIKDSFPINFHSGNRGPKMRTMLYPKNNTLSDDMQKGIITFQAKDIKIEQSGEHEIITLKKPRLFKGDKLIFKTPAVKIYTNKKHDYAETDHWEIGSIRGLGLFAGPGFVAPLPKGSIFKVIPMLNYKSGFGLGAVGRFQSGTNKTTLAYGTAMEKFLAYGRQELDDNLFLHYGVNNYMPEWFLGRRRPKYGVSLVYQTNMSSENFLIKGQTSTFGHRFEGGYFHDLDFDKNFEKIKGGDTATSRFRYMAQASQSFYKYRDAKELKAVNVSLVSQLATSIYGTGDTQVIGRIGPALHLQYKRWMQDIVYYLSVYDDNTPMQRFDAYRYGKQAIALREYFRICRWLTVSWFGKVNLSNDSPNGEKLQENGFYVSVGPDDVKLNLGYDFVREALRCTLELMADAKGTKVEYEKFEIKQDNKPKKAQKKQEKPQKVSPKTAPVQQKVLERAVVENIKEHEDVL